MLLRANCTGIQSGADGAAIEYVTVATLTGRRFTVAASAFVLAVGGLETPRLLLASRDVHMDGLGNATDLVGRFYMSHISGAVGSFRPRGGASRVHHGYERDADSVYCRRRLRLTDEAARELGVGNFIARLHHPAIADPVHRSGVLSALCLSRRMFSYEYRQTAARRGGGGLGRLARPSAQHRGGPVRGRGIRLRHGAPARLRAAQVPLARGPSRDRDVQRRLPRRAAAEPGKPGAAL